MTRNEVDRYLSELAGHMSSPTDNALSSSEKDVIAALYTQVLGKTIRECNCRDKYTDAIAEIKHFISTHKTIRTMSKYIMKRGVVIQYAGETYSCLNITDKVAEAFLKERPMAAWMFDHIPSEEEHQDVSAEKPKRVPKKKKDAE